jgi:hypothetical protein
MTNWHREAIPDSVAKTLSEVAALEPMSAFYLAGGTGLAVHFGHRRSVDLDLFSASHSDEQRWLATLSNSLAGFELASIAPGTLHFACHGTKVSLLAYRYSLLFATESFEGVRVADPRDIACMKISAVASRGTRRDFVDLYFASERYGFSHLLDLFERKYAEVRYSRIHVLKSFAYYVDAEKDPMPDMLVAVSWD